MDENELREFEADVDKGYEEVVHRVAMQRKPTTTYSSQIWGEEVELDDTVMAVAQYTLEVIEGFGNVPHSIRSTPLDSVVFWLNERGFTEEAESLLGTSPENREHWLRVTFQDALDFLFGSDSPVARV